MVTSFMAFLGAPFVVIATPAPDTAITVATRCSAGVRPACSRHWGFAVGQTVWAFATSAGIVAILVASEPLFLAIKYAGAAYLVYLGFQALREAIAPSDRLHQRSHDLQPSRRLRPLIAFRQGLISDLGNPKMAVFFASLLPQFAPAGPASFSALLFLGVVFAIMTFAWLTLYATMIAKAGDFLRRPAVRRAVEGVTGALLVGLGVRIATEQR